MLTSGYMMLITTLSTILIFTNAFPSAPLNAAGAAIVQVPNTKPADRRKHVKNGCDYDTPCVPFAWAPGLHCGDNLQGCAWGHVFQVGNDGVVCDLGTRKSCKECGELKC
ncbi:hypothetical protein CPB86DRAFT_787290 [Serendipita vermifera]|nr:hypothetical protein CPB86DRAFT_787290 [Serendipita vermifera]